VLPAALLLLLAARCFSVEGNRAKSVYVGRIWYGWTKESMTHILLGSFHLLQEKEPKRTKKNRLRSSPHSYGDSSFIGIIRSWEPLLMGPSLKNGAKDKWRWE